MPRIEPRRWLLVLFALAAPIGIGLAIVYRSMGGTGAPPSAFTS